MGRSHDGLKQASLNKCENCGESKLPHRVCQNCGQYKNREVIKIIAAKRNNKAKNKN